MKITAKLRNQLLLLSSDIGAQAQLITVGATDEKDKLLALLGQLGDKLGEAEIIPATPGPAEAAYDH